MFAALIFRNVLRSLPRLLPMLIVLGITFALLLVGNGILAASRDALYRTYTAHVSGDFSVAAPGEQTFTIFGSNALLVGEYLVPPTIVGHEEIRGFLEEHEAARVRATAEIVTSVARVEIDARRRNQTLFGVDFDRYSRLFPELEIVAGSVPAPGERGILLQKGWAGAAGETEALIGQPALLSVAHELSFTIREVPVTGVFRYPVEDDLLARVALVDPDTARALNGYIYGAASAVDIPRQDRDLFESDFDDLFSSDDQMDWDDPGDDPGEELDPLAALDSFFMESRDEAIEARRTVEGAWNFLLVSLYNRDDAPAVMRELVSAGFTRQEGYLIRDWRRTVGGTAELVWYLQLIFNGGLLFVAFGAAIITTNALVLSVLERTAEIGTMRALGAGRGRVAAMVAAETVIAVSAAVLVGLALGTVALARLGGAGFIPENPYLAILFGGDPVRGTVTLRLLAAHLLAGLVLALVAVVYPLKRALGISPVQAMAA